MESRIVKEWQEQADVRATVRAVLDFLEVRCGSLPADLVEAARACADLSRLRRWTRQAAKVSSLDEFRKTMAS